MGKDIARTFAPASLYPASLTPKQMKTLKDSFRNSMHTTTTLNGSNFLQDSEVNYQLICLWLWYIKYVCLVITLSYSEFRWKNKLRYVRIYFDTPEFDRITKDRAAKFVDMLSAIGGTMGLLTGFSIISAVEIFYYVNKLIMSFLIKKKLHWHNNCMRWHETEN